MRKLVHGFAASTLVFGAMQAEAMTRLRVELEHPDGFAAPR